MDVRYDVFEMFHNLNKLTTAGYACKRFQDYLEKAVFDEKTTDWTLEQLRAKYVSLIDDVINIAVDLRNKAHEQQK